jgi:hypothetical protein
VGQAPSSILFTIQSVSEAFMTALDRILKMVALIRMFGVAPAAPTEQDDLVSYVAALRRQLCAVTAKQGVRATRNALTLARLSIKMLGPTTAAEPLPPRLLRLLQSHLGPEPARSNEGDNCRPYPG